VLEVEVIEGKLRMGTLLCCIVGETVEGTPMVLELGRVTSIQQNHVDQQVAKAGGVAVAIKIEAQNDDQRSVVFGRHFTEKHILYSRVTKESIDALKEIFHGDISQQDLKLLVKLKKLFGVK
jgi:translation initiation factor 5B